MYKLLLDTNVLLDYFLGRKPGCAACAKLIGVSVDGQHALYVPSLVLKDLYYLLQVSLKRVERSVSGAVEEPSAAAINTIAWTCVRKVFEFAIVVGVDSNTCLQAITYRSLHGDFEDDLLMAAARECKADFIVSNDERLCAHAPVACLTSQEAVALLESEAEVRKRP